MYKYGIQIRVFYDVYLNKFSWEGLYWGPSRKIHSTTLHETPQYRAQSCISIHPGKEEDINKREQEADPNQRQAVDPYKNLENCE